MCDIEHSMSLLYIAASSVYRTVHLDCKLQNKNYHESAVALTFMERC